MMKRMGLSRCIALTFLLGSATLPGVRPVHAQDLPAIALSPEEIQSFKTLKNRLYACILAIQPRATVHTNDGYSFSGSHNDEFSLTVTLKQDTMHYRTPMASQSLQGEQKERFETSYTMRHNLEAVDPKARVESPVVPTGNINYKYLWTLMEAGLSEKSSILYSGRSFEMTRYEFAIATARLTERFQIESKSQSYKGLSIADAYSHARAHYSPEVAEAFLSLTAEFSPDWVIFGEKTDPNDIEKPLVEGQPWRPRYKYLDVQFSYGKGIDEKVVAEMKRALADCAATFGHR